jgi:hypothetical protein
VSRQRLPIAQRHARDCTRPGRGCGCPWTLRVRLPDGTMPRVTRDSYEDVRAAYYELMAGHGTTLVTVRLGAEAVAELDRHAALSSRAEAAAQILTRWLSDHRTESDHNAA